MPIITGLSVAVSLTDSNHGRKASAPQGKFMMELEAIILGPVNARRSPCNWPWQAVILSILKGLSKDEKQGPYPE